MSNFFEDNADIGFHLQTMDLERVVDLKENGFAEKDAFAYAPEDQEDALDNYRRVLQIVGEIAADFIAPRAHLVDQEGARFRDGCVQYAQGTRESLQRLARADLMGFTLPRKYGGINMPKTIYSMAIEMVSRADASLMNLFGLQEIADTISKFGTEEQKKKYLPRFCSGEASGAMALTEPDAGSDLQAVRLKAVLEDDGQWYLDGVKRFITNGCADISLVMARSEPGSSGGRGLSLFIYESDETMKIRRIEDKLGIHGSPTCEIQFNHAPVELLGRRKMGLIKYTMSLMNGARLGVAAQAVGIAEAAYRAAAKYASERTQFKQPIRRFAAVYEMLTEMKVEIEACRSLLYETSRVVDIAEGLEERMEQDPAAKGQLRADVKKYTRYASLLTPMVKGRASESANRVSYDALQIHGGVGYTKDFDVERYTRDARITNIYEGTTQLQVVAAIGGVMTGVVFDLLDDYENRYDFEAVAGLRAQARELRRRLEQGVDVVKEEHDHVFQELHAGRLVEMATDVVLAYLLCVDALQTARKQKVARLFIQGADLRSLAGLELIRSRDRSLIEYHEAIIDGAE
ncbi:MAG: acyl-CoA dehydrogenase family protein [Desulfohalobiaceae bacterium]|nr:acyl-CoA dehydrogenase family protein [Desulfohalobiaceae bacterium]